MSLLPIAILRFGTSSKPLLAVIWIIELFHAFYTINTDPCCSVVFIKVVPVAFKFLFVSKQFNCFILDRTFGCFRQ